MKCYHIFYIAVCLRVSEFYFRLPVDAYHTVKVAKVLLLLEKGKGNQFKGENLEDIESDSDIYCSSDSDDLYSKNI